MSHEQHLTLDLIARLAGRFGPSSRVAKELPGWLEYLTEVECPERPSTRPGAIWWDKVRRLAQSLVPAAGGGEGEILGRNAALLGDHFGLSPVETRILAFVAFYRIFDGFEHVVNGALDTREVTIPLLLSWFCRAPEPAIRAAIRPTGRLVTSGLVHSERGRRYTRIPFDLSDRLLRALLADVAGIGDLIGLMFPRAAAPAAEWQDFEGLGRDAVLMRDLISHALASGTAGVNVLLYGPPGTGKTEFAKVLAREVGAELRAVGENDDEGGEPSRRERLAEMGMACRMLGARSDTVLLFDEMEDLLGGASPFSGRDRPSKVHMNRMLESNPIPVIWTTNWVDFCDPAFLRRMSYSALMRPPSGRVRARIWQRLEARHGVGLAADALPQLAEHHDQAPALVSDAMRMARLCEGGETVVSQVLEAAARLAKGGADNAPRHHSEVPWHPDLAHADMDLARIEVRLAAPDAPRRVSFCLEGPAGTGKSAWARHLARVIGMPVIEKRASDLISKWVGESEQNIARAFAEARAADAMLIFDEADSLLADRHEAERSWEVSQVNEMLTWMESHPLPFVCTTNFVEKLDPATQRRFTFRIRFGHLCAEQLPLAWAAHFSGPAPAGLALLDRLAPGDFANVARRMRALGETGAQAILGELAREATAKEGEARPIGFGR
ncbi:AAA family ATPase [Ruixingdingia sedimenti]|uniref:AAA family ATPase n=1 Tax=Ruixingdingia sedimenti TaxID=3073604 RepID=A0ABU1FE67_9RHOB|nr:AAA family ATPase [Xinfangfangia sp. LG-4]MDR5655188.1 AAA family ATPase [Xinfangfangia sp. LG-4]